jgi:Cytochrome P460
MKGIAFAIGALLVLVGLATYQATGAEQTTGAGAPVFGIKLFPGYRDWKLVSVAHEEGNLNDIRAILGNEKAIEAYRSGRNSFPDGTVIARLAWNYVPSVENNKVFGRDQSFVAGTAPEWYLQFMVKDSKKYASTGGWGYAQFDKDGNPANAAKHEACFGCHVPAKERDYIFTRYAP